MTDEMIMEAVKNGDLNLASVLFERYSKPIYNFLVRMTTDRAAAEDLTQNVFMRILRYRSSYRDGARFQTWIYQVARNVFSDHYQQQRNQRQSFIDVEQVSATVADTDDTAQQEKEALLHKCLQRLDPEQRELLILTRFEHLKYEEVAVIMNTTVVNIKVRVHRAIGKLREYYFEMEGI